MLKKQFFFIDGKIMRLSIIEYYNKSIKFALR